MQENFNDDSGIKKHNNSYNDTELLKSLVDETFLLNYLIINEIGDKRLDTILKKEDISDKIAENMVNQLLLVDSDITLEKLNSIIGKKFEVIKYKQVSSTKKIEEIFNNKINGYFKKIERFKW